MNAYSAKDLRVIEWCEFVPLYDQIPVPLCVESDDEAAWRLWDASVQLLNKETT